MCSFRIQFYSQTSVCCYLIIFYFVSCVSKKKSNPNASFEYTLESIIEVDGRQGVATDGKYYIVSDSKALYRYTLNGELLNKNITPFKKLSGEANHLGDITIYKDEIFAGVENFINGRGENIQIVIYNIDDLKYKRSIPWNPSSGQVEVCGIAVDEKKHTIWLADWVNGQYLYKYNLHSGEYSGRLKIVPTPVKIQGIMVYQDQIFLTADDGDADKDEHDNLYSITIPSYAQSEGEETNLVSEKLLDEFTKAGEVEGLCLSPDVTKLSILMNRGSRIIQGVPQGFYPGYDREIHEIYVYNIKRRDSEL